MKISKKLLAVSAALLVSQFASANIYTFTGSGVGLPQGGEGKQNTLSNFSVSYDNSAQTLNLSSTFASGTTDGTPEGFWFVLSDGANPKGVTNQLPIFYVDYRNAASGSSTITAYDYNGANSNNSFSTTTWRQTWQNAVTVAAGAGGAQTVSFSLNVAALNANYGGNVTNNQLGVDFSNNVGVWFHWFDQGTTAATQMTYSGTGTTARLATLGYTSGSQGWYDAANLATTCKASATGGACSTGGGGGGTKVPEPTTPLLIGAGLFALLAARKYKK